MVEELFSFLGLKFLVGECCLVESGCELLDSLNAVLVHPLMVLGVLLVSRALVQPEVQKLPGARPVGSLRSEGCKQFSGGYPGYPAKELQEGYKSTKEAKFYILSALDCR